MSANQDSNLPSTNKCGGRVNLNYQYNNRATTRDFARTYPTRRDNKRSESCPAGLTKINAMQDYNVQVEGLWRTDKKVVLSLDNPTQFLKYHRSNKKPVEECESEDKQLWGEDTILPPTIESSATGSSYQVSPQINIKIHKKHHIRSKSVPLKNIMLYPEIADAIWLNNQTIDFQHYRPHRGGIIYYTKHNNEYYFCLGIDYVTQEITDFGGTIEYEADKDALTGSLREGYEETLGTFGKISYQTILNSFSLSNENMMISFVEVSVSISDSQNKFLEKMQAVKTGKLEIKELIWLNTTQLSSLINEEKINNYRGFGIVMRFLKNLLQKYPDFIKDILLFS